jgi:hypothetical protein
MWTFLIVYQSGHEWPFSKHPDWFLDLEGKCPSEGEGADNGITAFFTTPLFIFVFVSVFLAPMSFIFLLSKQEKGGGSPTDLLMKIKV